MWGWLGVAAITATIIWAVYWWVDRINEGIVETTEPSIVQGDSGRRAVTKAISSGTPEETLDAYLAAMAVHQGSPDLPIYAKETQNMLRGRTVTPAQMDNIAEAARNCRKDAVKINEAAGLAVIRYAIGSRDCPPYFFRRVQGTWRLDLTTPQKYIRFSVRKHWRFVNGPPEEFAFAFEGWAFNQFGFPSLISIR